MTKAYDLTKLPNYVNMFDRRGYCVGYKFGEVEDRWGIRYLRLKNGRRFNYFTADGKRLPRARMRRGLLTQTWGGLDSYNDIDIERLLKYPENAAVLDPDYRPEEEKSAAKVAAVFTGFDAWE